MLNDNIINKFIDDNVLHFSPCTKNKYKYIISEFFILCEKDYDQVKQNDVRKWLDKLYNHNKPKTIALKLTALNSFYRYCIDEGLVVKNPVRKDMFPKVPDRLPDYLEKDQLLKLIEVTKGNLLDRAIVLTLYSTGVRASELINIKLDDISWEDRTIRILRGKDKKDRLVFFTAKCQEGLKEYLSMRKGNSPYLFVKEGGNLLNRSDLHYCISKYSKKVGFKVYPHILRHTLAAYLAEKGMPLSYIQEILGHDDIRNTQIYTRLYEKSRKKQYDKFF